MNNRRKLLRAALIVTDYVVAVVVFMLAARIRFGADWTEVTGSALPPEPQTTVPLAAVGIVTIFWFSGLYRLRKRWSTGAEARDVLRAVAITLVVALGVLYLFRLDDVSRIFMAAYFTLLGVGALLARTIVRLGYRWRGSRGLGLRYMLVVGGGPLAERFVQRATAHPAMPVSVVGVVDDDVARAGTFRWLGPVSELPKILSEEIVDEVAVCLPWQEWPTVDLVARHCEEQGKVVRIPVDPMEHAISKGSLEYFDGMHVLSLVSGPNRAFALAVKRGIDLALAALMLTLTSPVLIAASVAVFIDDGRPIFFRQMRGGLHARPFGALKFRTMVRDAEDRKHELLDLNERIGPAFKVTNDPRVTRVGRFLRRHSIDELPQLFNVLKGEMSLVGPRPQPLAEVQAYDLWHRRRLSVRPGLTGLWQVSAREDPSFERWIELDLRYIDEWSLWQDAKLLAKTPAALIRSPGH